MVFTPDGLFDASPEGERSVTWRHESARGAGRHRGLAIARLEQFREQRFVFDLAETLSHGEDPRPPARVPEAPPPQLILEPVSTLGPGRRQVDVQIRVSEAGITDLRLYHNGVAVFADQKPGDRTVNGDPHAGQWPQPNLCPGWTRGKHRRPLEGAFCSIMTGRRPAGCTCSPWVSASIGPKPCGTRRRMPLAVAAFLRQRGVGIGPNQSMAPIVLRQRRRANERKSRKNSRN